MEGVQAGDGGGRPRVQDTQLEEEEVKTGLMSECQTS